MIISFANQKGGVGKSTHCALFAHYLSEKEKVVHVIDMDYQRSLKNKRQNDTVSVSAKREGEEVVFDNTLNFSVDAVNPDNILKFLDSAKTNEDAIYIFDTPGNLAHENVIKTLYLSDFIIVPFNYTELRLDSTAIFVQIVQKFKIPAKLIFMPNDIDRRIKLDSAEKVNEIFCKMGVVAPILYHYADIERFSTVEFNKRQREVILPTYDFIYKQLTL